VPVHDFLFALQLSANGGFDEMLRELAGSVLQHVGYDAAALHAVGDEVRAAIAKGGRSGGVFDVRFRAHAGTLEVRVIESGRALASITRQLPS